jgi:DNA-binding ferritin-like protein
MLNSTVLSKYLKSAMDSSTWEESKHSRDDDGKFTSGDKGKKKEDVPKDKPKDGKIREEMNQERAEKYVRTAFKEANKPLKKVELVNRSIKADTDVADENTLKTINEVLKKHGLAARIEDNNSYRIAEDGFDDLRVVDDPMLNLLVCLCKFDLVAKDLHYRAKGKPFYGIHQLADFVGEINRKADDINEVYYMGEKVEDPPERAYVAGKAAELVGKSGDEDALIKSLAEICQETASAVEVAKKDGTLPSGVHAILDDISKLALRAKGFMTRTMENSAVIGNAVKKGVVIKENE